MRKNIRVSFTLPKETNEKLKKYCDETGRKMSPLVTILIKKYLNEKGND